MSGPQIDEQLPKAVGADEQGNRAYWGKYAWPEGGDEWSRPWGGSASLWYSTILPRIWPLLPDAEDDGRHSPKGTIVELACGYGRCSGYLRRHGGKLIGVDITPKCVEACRERFADDPRCEFVVNDGKTLPMVADGSADFIFSWDSLVHVGHDVMKAYVGEIARALTPGGRAFLHHSNLAAQAHLLKGDEKADVLGGRRPSMSAAKMREDCKTAGLVCESQEIIPWNNGTLWLDCISVIHKPRAGETVDIASHEPRMLDRTDWGGEKQRAIWTAWLYGQRRANEQFHSA